MKVCNVAGCPELFNGRGGRCPAHERQAQRARGTSSQRGYTSRGHATFRAAVLQRDPICVACNLAPSTVADHYPHTRRELVELGLNPNDPSRGRGLCKRCHDKHTAQTSPGGWHNPEATPRRVPPPHPLPTDRRGGLFHVDACGALIFGRSEP